jgi:hypothetical protein
VFTKNPPQTIPKSTKQSAKQSATFKNITIPLMDVTDAARLHDPTSMKVNSASVNNNGVETTMKAVADCKKQLPIKEEIKDDG